MTVTINQLPVELLSLIFVPPNERHSYDSALVIQRNLYNYALVNRTFHQVANPLLWQYCIIRYDNEADTFLDNMENSSFQVGNHIKRLVLQSPNYWNATNLMRLLEQTKSSLEHLTIHNATFTTDTFMLRFADSLSTTKFRSLTLTESPLTNRSITQFANQLEQLCELNLSRCRGLTYQFLASLIVLPLESLVVDVGYLNGIWRDENVTVFLLHLARLRRLKHLGLHNTSTYFLRQLTIQTEAVWPDLTDLTLIHTGGINSNGQWQHVNTWNRLFQAHPGLTRLHLSVGVSDDLLQLIPSSSSLTYLDISHQLYISVVGLRRLILHCPQLAFINIQRCGILSKHFPELGADYPGYGPNPMYYDRGYRVINWLDRDALAVIRRGDGGTQRQ